MSLEESAAEFSAPHQWLCGGAVLRMEEPAAKDNMALFKVNTIFNKLALLWGEAQKKNCQ